MKRLLNISFDIVKEHKYEFFNCEQISSKL